MTLWFTLLGRLGLPEPYRRGVAIAALAGATLFGLAMLKGCYDRSVIVRYQTQIGARADAARSQAEAERASDAAIVSSNQEDLAHAIDAAPQGGTLSPAAHALACERLRKLGRIPAACRPRGTD